MLTAGMRGAEFDLRDVDGEWHALKASAAPLTLAIFFKTTCPTCHYVWDDYGRLHNAYANHGLRVLGISQHDLERTRAYRDQHAVTFPHLIDTEFIASRAYDPAFVPTAFLIQRDGTIVELLESWNKTRFNHLAKRIAETLGVNAKEMIAAPASAVETKIG